MTKSGAQENKRNIHVETTVTLILSLFDKLMQGTALGAPAPREVK